MRGSADAAVGMMDAAYFTGRKELLEFFNELLDLNLTKIEQTAPGAIACQVTEMIFPGCIAMTRVNWGARSDYEFIQNYKLLQGAFNKHHVQRHVDVDKLIRAKYQDNLEFCQWLKAFYDQTGLCREDYNASAVREKGKGGKKYNEQMGRGGKKSMIAKKAPTRPRPSAAAPTPRPVNTAMPAKPKPKQPEIKPQPVVMTNENEKPQDASENDLSTTSMVTDASLMKRNAELMARNVLLEESVLEIEKERDFYFEKLRNVEVLLQVHQEKGEEGDPVHLVDSVFKILYAVAEDKLTVNDEGEVIEEGEDEEDVFLDAT